MGILDIFSNNGQVKEQKLVIPAKGEEWYIKDKSPWPKKNTATVEILDYKDGWVRYKHGNFVFNDERMELERFLDVYSLLDEV